MCETRTTLSDSFVSFDFNVNETINDFIYSWDFKGALHITSKIIIDIQLSYRGTHRYRTQ